MVNELREREGVLFSTQWRPTSREEIGFNNIGFSVDKNRTQSVIDIPEWSLHPDLFTEVSLD
ncbi:hypothetical protein, partial [Pseudoalteromonas sp. S1610]|uniref:hypothetical protein n=1 Tax=Pseudoalteromonas sp. S1610 TaxID=579506 RepID=UPI00201D4BD7